VDIPTAKQRSPPCQSHGLCTVVVLYLWNQKIIQVLLSYKCQTNEMVWGFWRCFMNPSVFSTSFPSTAKAFLFSSFWMQGWFSLVFGPWGKIKCSKMYTGSQYMKMYYLTGAGRWRHSSVRYCFIFSALFGCGECPCDALKIKCTCHRIMQMAVCPKVPHYCSLLTFLVWVFRVTETKVPVLTADLKLDMKPSLRLCQFLSDYGVALYQLSVWKSGLVWLLSPWWL